MNRKWLQSRMARRLFLTGLGASVVGASAVGYPTTVAHAAEDAPWRPARHPQDDWLDEIPGEHRFIFDTTSADGMASALRFADNYFTANRDAYGLKESDLAVVIVARHKSTPFAYGDAIWAKYGKQLSEQTEFTDPKTKQPPTINVYATTQAGTRQAGRMNGLIEKGVHFAVCQMSTESLAGTIARAHGAQPGRVMKEIAANLVGNARLVSAGIVAVNRAQERGYSFVYAS